MEDTTFNFRPPLFRKVQKRGPKSDKKGSKIDKKGSKIDKMGQKTRFLAQFYDKSMIIWLRIIEKRPF